MPGVLTTSAVPIAETSSGRRELADWLVDPQQGGRLSSRVMANRLWHWHFGRGLVASTDDFGLQASPLRHEALLNFLAAELTDRSGSIKQVQRLLLNSAAYRMSTESRSPEFLEVDPANATWYRWEARRLDAETLRDSMLWHSGGLDLGLAGENLSVKSQDPSPTDLQNNHLAYSGFRRRSVYLPIVRSNTYKWLTLFDFPNSSACVGRRDETVVPTQALMLLNDQHLVELAEQVAHKTLAELSLMPEVQPTGESPLSKAGSKRFADRLFENLMGRKPNSKELGILVELATSNDSVAESDTPLQPTRSQIQLAQVLLMSNEFFYLP